MLDDLSFLDGLDLDLLDSMVVITAYDYRDARERLKINPKNRDALKTKKECEEFFLSDNFDFYTSVDGSYILRKLEEEFE